jgi:hypothetical protein
VEALPAKECREMLPEITSDEVIDTEDGVTYFCVPEFDRILTVNISQQMNF